MTETSVSDHPEPTGLVAAVKAPVTRRGFITRAGLGAAAVGVMGSLPGVATAGVGVGEATEGAATVASAETMAGPLIAQVTDFSSGEISLMSGMREVVVRDPQLVSQLLRVVKP